MGINERFALRLPTRAVEYGGCWWEEGCFAIPVRDWAALKAQIIAIYDEHQNWLYHRALEVYDSVRRSKKRGVAWHLGYLQDPMVQSMSLQLVYTLRPSLFRKDADVFCRPLKEHFKPHQARETCLSFTTDALFVMDRETCTFRWSVRGKTSSRIHTEIPAVRELFDLLAEHPYPRGTGGIVRTPKGDIGFGPLGRVLIGT